jgi:hypothetical protein
LAQAGILLAATDATDAGGGSRNTLFCMALGQADVSPPEILTIEELVAAAEINMPYRRTLSATFKRAPKPKGTKTKHRPLPLDQDEE